MKSSNLWHTKKSKKVKERSIFTQYLVNQAVSSFFCVFIIFILNKLDRNLSPKLRKKLNGKKINGCQPKPENKYVLEEMYQQSASGYNSSIVEKKAFLIGHHHFSVCTGFPLPIKTIATFTSLEAPSLTNPSL